MPSLGYLDNAVGNPHFKTQAERKTTSPVGSTFVQWLPVELSCSLPRWDSLKPCLKDIWPLSGDIPFAYFSHVWLTISCFVSGLCLMASLAALCSCSSCQRLVKWFIAGGAFNCLQRISVCPVHLSASWPFSQTSEVPFKLDVLSSDRNLGPFLKQVVYHLLGFWFFMTAGTRATFTTALMK